jgi:hypothetical protein
MSKKKKIIKYILVVPLVIFVVVYLYVVIHTNFISPSVSADGASSAYNYMKYQRELEKKE